MNMQQCPNGHFYDQSKTPSCPYCSGASDSSGWNAPANDSVGRTAPVMQQGGSNDFGNFNSSIGRTMPVGAMEDDRRTEAVIRKNIGIDPVVGWFVCILGADKGRDYHIHDGNNAIGRGDKMDISIQGDSTISREDTATVSYIGKSRQYFLTAGKGRNIMLVNDTPLLPSQTRELKARDILAFGETKLMFMPFCTEEFDWE